MGRKALVVKYIENTHDRKRTYHVRLDTLERKIQELEIMTGCRINMEVIKTATNVSSTKPNYKNKKPKKSPKQETNMQHADMTQASNSAFFGDNMTFSTRMGSENNEMLTNEHFMHGQRKDNE
jgi:hypothetical protein